MAQTANHGLPYPLPTGDVRMGASDIQALAEEVDRRLGGAVLLATVDQRSVAHNVARRLDLTVDEEKTSGVFVNAGAGENAIRYVGLATVAATLYVNVVWQGNAAGARRVYLMRNGAELVVDRETPDAEQVSQTFAWPTELATGDVLAVDVHQTSGGPLDVMRSRFRCVTHGIAPA